jgi:hypothetical protein
MCEVLGSVISTIKFSSEDSSVLFIVGRLFITDSILLLLVCSGFLRPHDSILVDYMCLEIYPFLLGCPYFSVTSCNVFPFSLSLFGGTGV